jgi:SAM-dependent methyltransferase
MTDEKEPRVRKPLTLPRSYFQRYDESDDRLFYTQPRLTVHLDNRAIAALQTFLLHTMPFHATVLDLMSSYRSHLPASLPVEHVVGLGLNAEEMRQNPQLDEFVLHDLNRNPKIPFADASFDAVLCTVSVQYLTQPVAVFAEVGRVLRPGGSLIVSFSNRCFPSKAVYIWLHTSDTQHLDLVQTYLTAAGGFRHITAHHLKARSPCSDLLLAVSGIRDDGSGETAL